MKQNRLMKFFSTFLAIVMVLSLLTPISSVSANDKTKPFKTGNQSESIIQQKAAIAEQVQLSDQLPRLHADLENLKGNQEVDVIIHLSENPAALEQGIKELKGQKFTAANEKKVKSNVNAQQAMLKKEMKTKKIKFKEKFSYNTVLNGFAATVQADELDELLELDGVTLIEPDTEVHAYEDELAKEDGQVFSELKEQGQVSPAMDTSIPFLGIEPLWAEGIEGQGIKVAVLDTGIDKDHPDFAGIYKGGKNFVPHNGNDYARERAADDASETSPLDRPNHRPEFNANGGSFYTSHGTHVAGTIAAIGANQYGIKGIAPKIDLYAYRVLGAYGSGSTSGIVAAIEESVKQEIDVINLSLGGGSNTESDAGSYAINNAMLAGTIGVIATGNSGPKRGTMGTPATAPFGIAVGNTTNPETMYDVELSVEAGDYSLTKQLNFMSTTYGMDLESQLAGEFDLVAVPGNGNEADFDGIDVDGKVALISRGAIAFVDKIANAKANGAVATIIHNFAGGTNAPGISDVFLGDDFAFLPTADMSQTDGDAIRAALANADGKVSFGNVQSTTTAGDEVNNSSSRGPSVPNFDIKPDVSAPGTNIMSTIPMYQADFPEVSYEQAFTRKTGTSMATPHIAGIAALVKQANPDWNAFDVKVALSNTAKVLDTDKYDVMAQGAGRVQAHAAAHANVLAYGVDQAIPEAGGKSVENLKGTVTFGPQNLKEGNISVTKEILVKDLKGVGGNYDVTVDVTKAFKDATVTVDKSSFTLAGEQLLTVTLTAPQTAATKAGDEILGYIHIDGVDTALSLPFAADFAGAAAAAIEDMAISETDLSFDGDGYKDSALLSFKLTGDVTTNFIELWDIMNPDGGPFGDGYIGYVHAGASLGAGSYTLNIAGQYKPWTSEPATTIPDGLYTIDFTGTTVSGNPPVIGDYAGPIVVKSEAGTIEGAISGTTATGQITDKYIEYNTELDKYGLGYAINTKLNASYEVTANGEIVETESIELQKNGSFTFDVATLNQSTESVVVKYVDAAGNKAQQTIYESDGEPEPDVVTYSVTPESLSLTVGDTEQLILTETTTAADGTVSEEDVTADATFVSSNDAVATVQNGNVTAVDAGNTEIAVSYEDFNAAIAVEVAAGETPPEEQRFVVSDEDISKYVNDKKAKEIILNVPAYEDEIAVEFTESILAEIQKSKKDLVIESDGASFAFKQSDVRKLAEAADGGATITLGNSDSSAIEAAISETYSIAIESGFGDNKQALKNFKAHIDIVLSIDESKLKNDKKVAVHEPNSKKPLKASYKKGQFEFKTKETGSFTAINE
ncbi:S8 family serine peptidase [Sporosarcina sp. G11-34]|uniref:S8 family serine peptidase n=1 Tax=Sporosarcina sp. G11-34 TaxID=2849605 RepID=UPI0022A97637|nr:S8 family serine peptidase [Sporosarcina sp. G11-34]MCZ2258677.1 S8 family serine peptidase [Sporosarcina sp. G11-34]